MYAMLIGGSVISPTLANMVLDGLELAVDQAGGVKHWGKSEPKRRINPNHLHLIRYADDFVVTCSDRNLLIGRIKPAIQQFLRNRGLELSEVKTHLTHINKGFDFLGQNIRKYNGKLLIKPSDKNVKVFLAKIKLRYGNYSYEIRRLSKTKSFLLYKIQGFYSLHYYSLFVPMKLFVTWLGYSAPLLIR